VTFGRSFGLGIGWRKRFDRGNRTICRGRDCRNLGCGQKYVWGRIKDWQPGERLKFSWLMGLDEAEASEVELAFVQEGPKCRVTLVHRNWDCYGEGARAKRDSYNKGWDLVFGECFLAASAEAE